ncbi:MAG: amidohydrolase [Fretibacterium sp.]|nr:amidohydrolase [Fretibacterium sp.]
MNLKKEAQALNDYAQALRRELHSHPELDHDLPLTEGVIVRELEKLGLDELKSGQGKGHGVWATLRGDRPGKVLALRADMDALPVREETGLPYAATNGCMHACGHDAHVAMLLAAARLLAGARAELAGTVRFIFQPAEETTDGALSMIQAGALENPSVDAIIGIHTGSIWDGLRPGQIGWKSGPMMAATTTVLAELRGKGGHGATPHLTVDPIVMAAEVLSQLQTLVSRETSPFEPAVVTFGKIEGGRQHNIIADSCRLSGTMRTFSHETNSFLQERLRATVEGVAASMRGHGTVEYVGQTPALLNDPALSFRMRDILTSVLGPDSVQELSLPSTGGEDFAEYLQKVPGAFFYHCSTFGDERDQPHHNSRFDVNESVLWTGVAALAAFALHWQEVSQ